MFNISSATKYVFKTRLIGKLINKPKIINKNNIEFNLKLEIINFYLPSPTKIKKTTNNNYIFLTVNTAEEHYEMCKNHLMQDFINFNFANITCPNNITCSSKLINLSKNKLVFIAGKIITYLNKPDTKKASILANYIKTLNIDTNFSTNYTKIYEIESYKMANPNCQVTKYLFKIENGQYGFQTRQYQKKLDRLGNKINRR